MNRAGESDRCSIAIIGAGIGGLTLARILQLRGVDQVRVFERGSRLSSRGGTIRLDPQGQRGLSTLGVLNRVEEIGIRNHSFNTFSNGRMLSQIHPELISISREGLQGVLAQSVSPGVLKLDKAVVSIQDSDPVPLGFADGTSDEFDLVIGADGVKSVVADQCFPGGDAVTFTGLVVYYCIAKGAYLPETVHTEHFISHGGLGFRMVTVAGGGSDGRWDSLQVTTRGPECSSEWDAEGTADEMTSYLDIAGDRCLPGAREILANADRVFKWGMYQSPEKSTWISENRRIALLGDAAHAMAPFTGQGAVSAITDGVVLGNLLAEHPQHQALETYQQIRKKTCEDEVRKAHDRGMQITSHGISRRYIDGMTSLLISCLNAQKKWLAPVIRGLAFTMNHGAAPLARVDKLVDIFRSKPTR